MISIKSGHSKAYTWQCFMILDSDWSEGVMMCSFARRNSTLSVLGSFTLLTNVDVLLDVYGRGLLDQSLVTVRRKVFRDFV